MKDDEYYFNCAIRMIQNSMAYVNTDPFELAELLKSLDEEKEYKQKLSDEKLDFNDEIFSIEEVGELETTDIAVSGDNLYYCNGILTKNSYGLAHTCDLILGIIRTEELDNLDQMMFKQLKNRYHDLNYYRRFVVGIDRPKMRLYDIEQSAQDNVTDSGETDKPVFNSTKFGSEEESREDRKKKFRSLNV